MRIWIFENMGTWYMVHLTEMPLKYRQSSVPTMYQLYSGI